MDIPLLKSFLESGWVGQAILIILFFASIFSWSIIIYKYKLLRQCRQAQRMFLSRFRSAARGVFKLSSPRLSREVDPFYAVYEKGCRDLHFTRGTEPENRVNDPAAWGRLEESLQRTADAEIGFLRKNLIFLATAASTGPLLGILGTVYGVLIAFQGMGKYGSATIDAVAPGISQALNTTVFGLIVAIPALIAYNYFSHTVNGISADLDNFIWEFLEKAKSHSSRGENRRQDHSTALKT